MGIFEKKTNPDPAMGNIYSLHDINLYLPTRTIYFGGDTINEDEVNATTIAQTIKNLMVLEHQNPGEPIKLILNSCGGSWFDGIALYDMIKSLASPLIIIAMGKVFSMGSIILQAGDVRVVTKHTTMMIHDGSDGYGGSPKSFEAWGKNSKAVREQSYNIYYNQMVNKNPKITLKKIEQMCSHDTILNAEQCVEMGLADQQMEEVEKYEKS